jgi:hypothetical protein
MTDPEQAPTPLEQRICARAKEFDLGPLLRLLEHEGYTSEQLLFESNPEPVSSSALVEAVTFHPAAGSFAKRVVVTLNLGLLGSQSLLPSYFLEVAEQSPDPEAFFDFIRFFDHRLLEGFVRALHPERNRALMKDWEHTQRLYFRMLGVGSVSTLQWLFQLHFPELRVCVTRDAFRAMTRSHALRTGQSRLDGTAVLGGLYDSDAAGFQVELHTEEATDARGTSWAHLVHRRLEETVLPLLRPFRLPLGVALNVQAQAGQARLDPRGYLGYERLPGAPAGYRLVLLRGDTLEATEASGLRPLPAHLL